MIPTLALLALLPVLPSFYVFLLCTALIYCIFALSLDFLMGYGGMPNFGQAVFFGIGAYVATMAQSWWNLGPIVGIALPYVFTVPLSFVLGRLSIRGGGIYFAMLTLIWGDIIYRIFFYEWTLGGSDGLRGAITFPTQPYYVVLVLATLACFLLLRRRIVNSQFGTILRAIRENETRMRYVGCDVEKYKVLAFVV